MDTTQNKMKKAYYLLIIMLMIGTTVIAQDNGSEVMAGTERPAYQQSSDTTKCFVFGEYVVKTSQPEGEGDDISIYRRVSSNNPKNECKTKGKPYLLIKDSDNNSFFGIAKNFLFVDSGTSVESRGLAVYNLASRRSVVTEGYTENIKLVGDRFVIYDTPSEKRGLIKACKEAAKWKREGGGVGWVQGMKLDLQTLTRTKIGGLRCVYME